MSPRERQRGKGWGGFGTIAGMLRKLRAVATVVALETLEHPVTVLLFLASAATTLLLPLFQFQRFTEDGRLARDCGLATAFLFGLLLAAGGAGRLWRTLTDGTAAAALVKPVGRGLWLLGHAVGLLAVLMLYGLTQGAATLLAEAASPRYHSGGTYGQSVPVALGLASVPVAALVLAALYNRFFRGRFALSANLLMALLLWAAVLFFRRPLQWGSLTALVAIGLAVVQVMQFALAAAVRCPPGLTVGLSLVLAACGMLFFGGAAYLPLDALAGGGAVPGRTLALLVPQTAAALLFFGWCGYRLLCGRELG